MDIVGNHMNQKNKNLIASSVIFWLWLFTGLLLAIAGTGIFVWLAFYDATILIQFIGSIIIFWAIYHYILVSILEKYYKEWFGIKTENETESYDDIIDLEHKI